MAGGLHGANRLGGNSLSDLVVFGLRAGRAAADYVRSLKSTPQAGTDQIIDAAREALAPFERDHGENPYSIQQDLQQTMQDLVGIIRVEEELTKALEEIQTLKERAKRVRVEGNRQYNPGWHLSIDLKSLLTVSECIAFAALERKESRGAQTRDDYPKSDPQFGQVNVALRQKDGELQIALEPLPQLPDDLRALVEEGA